jgi:hypothetical protein
MAFRVVLIAIAAVSFALAACGSDEDSVSRSQDSGQGEAPQEVTGPIVDIEAEGLGDVRSFTVKSGPQTYEILIDTHVDYGFPLSHLNEHRISGDPVRVELVERNGSLYAQTIVDA